MYSPLLLPVFIHIAWTGVLYVVLTIVRAPSVWEIGIHKDGVNPWADIEPRISANLSNQFEWPLFFHMVCVILISNAALYSRTYLWLAWVFVFGRILHSLVHILTSNVRLRGLVFTINFLAVICMWVSVIVN